MTARGPVAADTRLYGSKRSAVINRRVAILLRLTSDGVCDGAELGRSGEHPVIQHPLHVCHVHGHEELEDPWNPARPGLRPRFLDPAYASQKFRMSFRVDRNTRCSNSSAARLGTASAPPALPATGSRLPSRRGRSRSACVVNGRLGQTGEGAVRRAPPCVVSRVGFSVLHTSRACASAVHRTRQED